MSKEDVLGRYMHYKGNVYVVVNVGFHTEDEERVVIYHLETDVYGDQLWIRPYEMFFEQIEVEGKLIDRFKRLED